MIAIKNPFLFPHTRTPVNLIQLFILVFILVFGYSSCQDSNSRDEIPRVYVFEEVNLNDFRYHDLTLTGGYVYIDGGVRGIIVYRKSQDEFVAFERDCPFQPDNPCALVTVDNSNLFMTDTCCSSNFDFDGYPIAGPAEFPLLKYNTAVNQGILVISSD